MQIFRFRTEFHLVVLFIALSCAGSSLQVQASALDKPLRIPADRPALQAAKAVSANIVSATHAGGGDASRIVAVGDYGVVLLSDDGKSFRQAGEVPVQSTLTDVQFLDTEHGWAVGHDGVVLSTDDGGEHWRLLRRDDAARIPLLGVWFENPSHGIAVGQFGMAIETQDYGKTWSVIHPAGDDAESMDMHLNGIAGVRGGPLVIVGERGLILVSMDNGKHWEQHSTAQNGSLWNVIPLREGGFVAGGIGGHLYLSTKNGLQWRRVKVEGQESLNGITQIDDGSIWVAASGGLVLSSYDGGETFNMSTRADRLPLTSIVGSAAGPILFSPIGLVGAN